MFCNLHLHRRSSSASETRATGPLQQFLFCPVYPGVGGMSGNSLRNASRAVLKVVKVGTQEGLAKELNLRLLTI